MRIDSIVIIGIYLLIWTVIVSVVWPLKLIFEGVQVSQWSDEFELLFEILFLGWTTSLSLSVLFRMVRYSSGGRAVGSLAFGTATLLVYFVFIGVSGLLFDGRIVTYFDQVATHTHLALIYLGFFLVGAFIFTIIYDHT